VAEVLAELVDEVEGGTVVEPVQPVGGFRAIGAVGVFCVRGGVFRSGRSSGTAGRLGHGFGAFAGERVVALGEHDAAAEGAGDAFVGEGGFYGDGGVGAVDAVGDDLLVDDAGDVEADADEFAECGGIELIVYGLLVEDGVWVVADVDEEHERNKNIFSCRSHVVSWVRCG
jgi:hypothetical protein